MRTLLAAALLTVLTAACGAAAPNPSSSPVPSPIPSPDPSPLPSQLPTPSPLPSQTPGTDFYMRAWYTQALPPEPTFSWLPVLTIKDGVAIDGNVAVPAIFPGPLVIVPNARAISTDGILAIVAEARRMGLLEGATDFTGGPAPGAKLATIQMVADGVTVEITGDPEGLSRCPDRCIPQPGTPEAFGAFFQQISFLDSWIPDQLGPSRPYTPERVAVLLTTPQSADPGLEQPLATWPLAGSFDEMGVEFPSGDNLTRCMTLTGDDLAAVWPILTGANQLTVFHDEVDGQRSAVVAVLTPGQASPCPDEAALR